MFDCVLIGTAKKMRKNRNWKGHMMLIILWKGKYQKENIMKDVDLEIKVKKIKYMFVMLPEHRTES